MHAELQLRLDLSGQFIAQVEKPPASKRQVRMRGFSINLAPASIKFGQKIRILDIVQFQHFTRISEQDVIAPPGPGSTAFEKKRVTLRTKTVQVQQIEARFHDSLTNQQEASGTLSILIGSIEPGKNQ